MITKTVMAAIVGRPNVGKSTLANRLVGEKIAIVTPKPQTTRQRIFGIVSRGETQFVLLDTPGYHRARNKLGEYMDKMSTGSLEGADAAILVVEPKAEVGAQEKILIKAIAASKLPAILVINKIDTVEKEKILGVIAAYAALHDFDAVVPLSGKTGDGTQYLLDELEKYASEGEQLFDEEEYTDQPVRQMLAEILREKLLMCLDAEIPHGVAVEVTRYKTRDSGLVDLEMTIYCEKDSHKGMIIGKKGEMLKRINTLARRDMERLLDTEVFMQVWVRVKDNWRDSTALLKNFGFTEDN